MTVEEMRAALGLGPEVPDEIVVLLYAEWLADDDLLPAAGPEPLTLAQAKAACRIEADDTEEDAVLLGLIAAARAMIEAETGHLLVRRAVTETFDAFAPVLPLRAWPRPAHPVVTWIDDAGAPQVIGTARLAGRSWKARVTPPIGTDWPRAAAVPEAVRVTLIAGHDDGAVPPDLIRAMELLIVHWWRNREAVVTGTIATTLPLGVDALARPHRLISL